MKRVLLPLSLALAGAAPAQTLEEGLRCRDLAFVVGEIAGNPKALGFTAARRFSLAVERHGVPLWLVRLDAERALSSARQIYQSPVSSSWAKFTRPPPRIPNSIDIVFDR